MKRLATLQREARAEVQRCFRVARKQYGDDVQEVPVVFSNSLKKTAGLARYILNTRTGNCLTVEIRLSNHVMRLNGDEFVSCTPAHEAAHIIALQLYGLEGKGHGRRWKEVMRVLGQKPERCHTMQTMPTTKRQQHKYIATCGTEIVLKAGRHGKVQKGVTYIVKSTRGKISKECYRGVA